MERWVDENIKMGQMDIVNFDSGYIGVIKMYLYNRMGY
jgi:hypothetical protein